MIYDWGKDAPSVPKDLPACRASTVIAIARASYRIAAAEHGRGQSLS